MVFFARIPWRITAIIVVGTKLLLSLFGIFYPVQGKGHYLVSLILQNKGYQVVSLPFNGIITTIIVVGTKLLLSLLGIFYPLHGILRTTMIAIIIPSLRRKDTRRENKRAIIIARIYYFLFAKKGY